MQHEIRVFNSKTVDKWFVPVILLLMVGTVLGLGFGIGIIIDLGNVLGGLALILSGPTLGAATLTGIYTHATAKMSYAQNRVYGQLRDMNKTMPDFTPAIPAQTILHMEDDEANTVAYNLCQLEAEYEENLRVTKVRDHRIDDAKTEINEKIQYLREHTRELKKLNS